MKISPLYKMRTVVNEHLIMLPGGKAGELTKIISFNESSLLLWDKLQGRDFDLNDAQQILLQEYDVDPDQALADAERWVQTLTESGIIIP